MNGHGQEGETNLPKLAINVVLKDCNTNRWLVCAVLQTFIINKKLAMLRPTLKSTLCHVWVCRPLNSHDFVVWHTILSLISRSHAKLLFSHDLCSDVQLVFTVVSIKHCFSGCRGMKHIFFGFYARWRLFRSFEFWALLPYPQKCRESSLKMQEIAFQRHQISKFSAPEHAAWPPLEISRAFFARISSHPCFIYGLTTAFTLKLRGLGYVRLSVGLLFLIWRSVRKVQPASRLLRRLYNLHRLRPKEVSHKSTGSTLVARSSLDCLCKENLDF